MVSVETVIIGVVLMIIGFLFLYFRNYFSETIARVAMIIIGIIFLAIGAYYLIIGIVPAGTI